MTKLLLLKQGFRFVIFSLLLFTTSFLATLDGSPESTAYASVQSELTSSQAILTLHAYVDFLNAVGSTDTYNLYNDKMGDTSTACITRTGDPGSYSYQAIPEKEEDFVPFLSRLSAERYCNWLQHDCPQGEQNDTTTECGAYNLHGTMTENVEKENDAFCFLSSHSADLDDPSLASSASEYFIINSSAESLGLLTSSSKQQKFSSSETIEGIIGGIVVVGGAIAIWKTHSYCVENSEVKKRLEDEERRQNEREDNHHTFPNINSAATADRSKGSPLVRDEGDSSLPPAGNFSNTPQPSDPFLQQIADLKRSCNEQIARAEATKDKQKEAAWKQLYSDGSKLLSHYRTASVIIQYLEKEKKILQCDYDFRVQKKTVTYVDHYEVPHKISRYEALQQRCKNRLQNDQATLVVLDELAESLLANKNDSKNNISLQQQLRSVIEAHLELDYAGDRLSIYTILQDYDQMLLPFQEKLAKQQSLLTTLKESHGDSEKAQATNLINQNSYSARCYQKIATLREQLLYDIKIDAATAADRIREMIENYQDILGVADRADQSGQADSTLSSLAHEIADWRLKAAEIVEGNLHLANMEDHKLELENILEKSMHAENSFFDRIKHPHALLEEQIQIAQALSQSQTPQIANYNTAAHLAEEAMVLLQRTTATTTLPLTALWNQIATFKAVAAQAVARGDQTMTQHCHEIAEAGRASLLQLEELEKLIKQPSSEDLAQQMNSLLERHGTLLYCLYHDSRVFNEPALTTLHTDASLLFAEIRNIAIPVEKKQPVVMVQQTSPCVTPDVNTKTLQEIRQETMQQSVDEWEAGTDRDSSRPSSNLNTPAHKNAHPSPFSAGYFGSASLDVSPLPPAKFSTLCSLSLGKPGTLNFSGLSPDQRQPTIYEITSPTSSVSSPRLPQVKSSALPTTILQLMREQSTPTNQSWINNGLSFQSVSQRTRAQSY